MGVAVLVLMVMVALVVVVALVGLVVLFCGNGSGCGGPDGGVFRADMTYKIAT